MIENKGKKRAMNIRKGFTMFAAVIVICIIAMVVAIGIPTFRKMGVSGDLKAAVKDTVSDFSYVRERAISENQNYSIAFDQVNNNYTVPGLASPKAPASFAKGIMINSTSSGSNITFRSRATISLPGVNTIQKCGGLIKNGQCSGLQAYGEPHF